ncbi:MAG: PA-phosphatase [Thalassolituus sp. CG17_big_fil_post_rev_8_21_14_2_50_53_8]|nr:MAG: PA-phosphatase [Thalassolituus sp. CG17_big_fil_post_rev_8_21_14_2_50_53_8]
MKHTPWYHLAAATVLRHLFLKSIGTPLFIGVFFGAYFYLLKQPAYPTTVMPITWPDRLIPFQPWALPVYFSLWVYVSLPPALLATRRELSRYATVMAGTCLAGLIVFYFWPTVVPPADIDWALYPQVNFLKELDASGNAFPSLHVATAVFSGIWLHHLLRGFGAPRWIIFLNTLWCAGIVYSTLATRQHVAVDVWAGLLLGALAAIASVRYRLDTGASGNAQRFPK